MENNSAARGNGKRSRFSKVLSYITLPFRKFDSLLSSSGYSLLFIALFSVLINVLLEATLRQSVIKALNLIISEPIVFFNWSPYCFFNLFYNLSV